MNVVNLETERQKHEEVNNAAPNREDALIDALWFGVENSRWSKDPDNLEAEPSLGRFVSHVCDISPRTVLRLLSKFYEPPTN